MEMCSSGGSKYIRQKSFVDPHEAFYNEMCSSEVVWGSTWSSLEGNVFVRSRLGVHKEHFKRKCVRQGSSGGPCGAF